MATPYPNRFPKNQPIRSYASVTPMPSTGRNSARPASAGIKWLAAFFLLDSMQAFGFIDQLVYGNWLGKGGDKITQSLNLLMIASAIALFVYGCTRRRCFTAGAALVLAAIAYFFLTALWSVDPSATVREAMVYLFVVIGCIGLSGSLNSEEFMATLGSVCFASAIASILLLIMSPSDAMAADSADFQGIFAHKNFFGQVMATGSFTCLYALRTRAASRGWTIGLLIVFTVLAIYCKSTTAWLMISAFCGIELIVSLYARGGAMRMMGLSFAACCLPVLIIIAVNPDPILELIGKDPTLTGRTEIWQYVEQDISLKPILGWGYFAFWTVTNPAAMEIANTVKWFVPQAHNGLLEMLLNVGAVGTVLIFAIYVRNIHFAMSSLRTPERALGLSALIYCVGIFLLGISENVLLAPTQSSTTVFLVSGLMCEQAVRSAQRGRRGVQLQGQGVGRSPDGLPARRVSHRSSCA
jgi:exopolysaccharide production protein ExoQ